MHYGPFDLKASVMALVGGSEPVARAIIAECAAWFSDQGYTLPAATLNEVALSVPEE